MRYDKGHKETTRRRIVEVAAQSFRKQGIDGIGVADLMEKAGLSHGGFYAHFSSKDALVREALAESFERGRARWRQREEKEGDQIEGLIRHYLRPEHRDQPEKGCAAACLAPEVARQSKATREVFTANLAETLAHIQARLPECGSPAQRRQTAIAIFATMMGALQLARTTSDPEQSDEMLEAGIEAACKLARG